MLNGARVLIVEDEPIIALLLEDMLEALGCELAGAANTLAEAVELARSAPADAAILDINLNGEPSFTAAAELDRRGIPYFFATGYSSAPFAQEAGAAVVQKPYSVDQIEANLRDLLAGRRRTS